MSLPLHRFCLEIKPVSLVPVDLRHGSGSFISDRRPIFTGLAADIQNILNDGVFGLESKTHFNFTLLDRQFTATNKLSGCHLSLHENSSDIFLKPTPYPVGVDSIEVIDIIDQSRIEFITGYSSDNSIKDGDVLESFRSFPVLIWTMIIMTILSLYTAMTFSRKIHLKLKRKRRSESSMFSKIISQFMFQDFFYKLPSKSIFQLSFMLTIFSFMIHILYNSVVKTDLVIVRKPYTLYSFQDIIDNKSIIIHFFNEIEPLMRDSSLGTIDRRFYDAIEYRTWKYYDKAYRERMKNEIPYSKAIKDEFSRMYGEYLTMDINTSILFFLDFACSVKAHSQDEVINDMMGKELGLKTKHLYPWVHTDKESNPFLLVLVKRKDFIPDQRIKIRTKRFIEAGVSRMVQSRSEMKPDLMKEMISGLENRNQELRECLEFSRKLKIKEVGFQPIKLANLKGMGRLFILFIFIIIIVFICEKRFIAKRMRKGITKLIHYLIYR